MCAISLLESRMTSAWLYSRKFKRKKVLVSIKNSQIYMVKFKKMDIYF